MEDIIKEYQIQIEEKNEEIDDLNDRLAELEDENNKLAELLDQYGITY